MMMQQQQPVMHMPWKQQKTAMAAADSGDGCTHEACNQDRPRIPFAKNQSSFIELTIV